VGEQAEDGRLLSILVVEDNVVNQRVAAALLATIGHRVTIRSNGREAVQAVLEHDFDVILMDIQMPVLDGLAAAREIRALADPVKARIPIMAISANVAEADILRYRDSGIDEVLGKPLGPDKLKQLLSRYTAAPPPAAAAPADDLLDTAQIEALRQALAPTKLRELFDLARESLQSSADQLHSGWQKQDAAQIGAAAHRVAGVARNFGCLALGLCAARIEAAAQSDGNGRQEQAKFDSLLLRSLQAMPGVTDAV
jgi:CheY-like chemotaxis protein